jgi:hypothetical protein
MLRWRVWAPVPQIFVHTGQLTKLGIAQSTGGWSSAQDSDSNLVIFGPHRISRSRREGGCPHR